MEKLIVRTSDRYAFRKCRVFWDFTSKVRLNFEWVPGIEPLDFGIAVHKGMEIYYDPDRWKDDRVVVETEAILAFMGVMQDWKKRLQRVQQWDAQQGRWKELCELGKGMLTHYFMWAPAQDKQDGWEPVKAEIEFEVPVPVPDGIRLPKGFVKLDGQLYMEHGYHLDRNYELLPIVYQGRIDLIVQDRYTGKYWIVDHKTAAQFGQTEHLELDPQCGSYCWAVRKVLGIDVEGVVYQEMRKSYPKEPAVLKNGGLSKNKNQGTTVELYERAIKEGGYKRDDYVEFLDTLRTSQQVYFRRLPVDRSAAELDHLELNICLEAVDMFNNPSIYPNPSRWNCNGCAMRTPCLIRQEGGDFMWHLNHSTHYEQRK